MALIGTPFIARAQGVQTGALGVEVRTRDGKPVSHGRVRVRSSHLQGERLAITDAQGRTVFPLLPPGDYQVTVAAEGLQTGTSRLGVRLGEKSELRFGLAPVASAEVRVEGAQGSAFASAASVFEAGKLEEMPIPNTRVFESVLLAPGVCDGISGPQVRGARSTGNLYLVDGVGYADNYYGFPRINLFMDGLEETQVLRGAFSAEYGDVEGGIINSVTKSGGNEFETQYRMELNNADWNALRPYEGRHASHLDVTHSLTVGGPILKDRLWYFAGTYRGDLSPVKVLSAQAATGLGDTSYTENAQDRRTILKMTWAMAPEHTLVGSWHRQVKDEVHDYGAGELAALNQRTETSDLFGLQLRSVLVSNMALSTRVGFKRWGVQIDGAQADGVPPILNFDDGLLYGNAKFDRQGSVVHRDSDTGSLKLSVFGEALGHHELDLGLDLYRGWIQGDGSQSRIQWDVLGQSRQIWIFATGLDVQNRTAIPNSIGTFISVPGAKAVTETRAIYVNDQWQWGRLTGHFGLRGEAFRGFDQNHREIASGSAWSPRLGLGLDVFADRRWLVDVHFGRYRQRPMDSQISLATYADNPIEIDYATRLAARPTSYSRLADPSNYDFNTPVYCYDPAFNYVFDSNLRYERLDEWQIQLTRSLDWGATKGHIQAIAVRRSWKDLFDTTAGNDGTRLDSMGNSVYLMKVFNNPLAHREYRGLELEGVLETAPGQNRWRFEGNVTWSRLQGNASQEAPSFPMLGSGMAMYSQVNQVRLFEPSVVAPEGPLPTHNPLRMRFLATWERENGLGSGSVCLMYRFDSGQRLSATRQATRELLNPDLPEAFGYTWVQYQDQKRGTLIMPSVAFVDLALQQELRLATVRQRPVRVFAKLWVQNLFNHMQSSNQQAYNTLFESEYTSMAQPFTPSASYGSRASASYWAQARTVGVSLGVRY
ncbi:MAG TPA: carboxypeptidase regulatory-like domain-containing protein [Holophaga sp.]|nr:carboxypeptidase regulatory-like domain-containing protein [Holophaga sp.]